MALFSSYRGGKGNSLRGKGCKMISSSQISVDNEGFTMVTKKKDWLYWIIFFFSEAKTKRRYFFYRNIDQYCG